MKKMFIIFVIVMITVNSSPFLRRVEEVTEASCTKKNQDYDPGKPAQCLKGSTLFNVTSQDECNAGTWGKCSANATPKIVKAACSSAYTPDFTELTSGTCTVKKTGKVVEAGKGSQTDCNNAITFTATGCSVEGFTKDNCQGQGSWIKLGTCTLAA